MPPKVDDTLKRYIHRRNKIQENLTKFQTFFVNIARQQLLEVSEIEISQIKMRLEVCKQNDIEFNKIQGEIEFMDQSEDQKHVEDEYQELYYQIITEADLFIKKCSQLPSDSPITIQSASSNNLRGNVKLPTIQLPTFNGALEDWLSFHDTCNSLIHNDTNIDDVQKFHYLKASLQGNAAETIYALQVCALNYPVAWKMLKDKYENKKLIVDDHVKKLFQLPVVLKDSHASLEALRDKFLRNIRALEAIGEPSRDTLLMYLVTSKLDSETKDKWEEATIKIEQPTLVQLTEFLKERLQVLVRRRNTPLDSKDASRHQKPTNKYPTSHVSNTIICPYCQEAHFIYQCKKFLDLSRDEKYEAVRNLRLCLNCLRSSHLVYECMSTGCRRCNRKHNTLLHIEQQPQSLFVAKDEQQDSVTNSIANDDRSTKNPSPAFSHAAATTNGKIRNEVLLSTAVVDIVDYRGNLQPCRALLDNGSQTNFITSALARKLGLQSRDLDMLIGGIGESSTKSSRAVTATVKSRVSNFTSKQLFLVIPQITQPLPTNSLNIKHLNIPSHVQLADSNFNVPAPVDLLLGAEVYWDAICEEIIKPVRNIIMQNTKLGWLVSGGKFTISSRENKVSCNLSRNYDLNETLERFWRLETPQVETRRLTLQEQYCELHFKNNTKRNNDGRFVVSLPFKQECVLGESWTAALNRFHYLEKRLQRDPWLKSQYVEFLHEYEKLGHMTRISESNKGGYYLPHHAVCKESSTTTKLRVVFDASSKTTNGRSLNSVLEIGPTVQDELFSIILRFRKYPYVLTADIAKMYRQVLIENRDRVYQKILWRSDPAEEIKTYQLNTVTYGTSCAPYLATRCLKELAFQEENSFPMESTILKNSFYVDDMLTGAHSVKEAVNIYRGITRLLQRGGFELRKWRTNNSEILKSIMLDATNDPLTIDKNASSKTLGLLWNNQEDSFRFSVVFKNNSPVTKRTLLSEISQIFDPLGLIGPIIVRAKILMQALWNLKLDWDETVPESIFSTWRDYQAELNHLSDLAIERQANSMENYKSIELHGFSDASEVAYGCCIYLRTTAYDGMYYTRLLCAKSRVAPLKSTSLPRLELCGALLLAQLASRVIEALEIKFSKCTYWTDSTIVLGWIKSQSNQLKTFVANRVGEIQDLTNIDDWKHVRIHENPADIISRGISALDLKFSTLWWNGPEFLCHNEEHWVKSQTIEVNNLPERKIVVMILIPHQTFDLIQKYSSLIELKRVVAYCLRFAHNSKNFQADRRKGNLTAEELENSMKVLIKLAQKNQFQQDLEKLPKGKLHPKSKLLSLNPFVDHEGLLRVGGRLQNAPISYQQQHPVILPKGHHLTTLIINYEHLRNLHGGAQSVLASLRTKYWPIGGKNSVKGIIRQCVRCCRAKPITLEQIMGNLPASRVRVARPFSTCGVDYCGPFNLYHRRSRGVSIVKGYIAVFVCFSTKAAHLELVSDLTTDSFIGALRRFMCRRGKVANIFSDNATNFVGAKKELAELARLFASEQHRNKMEAFIAEEAINWKFIPPRTPHFGGLWEAAVKSVKHHLRRVVGYSALTYEEMNTLIAKIEACLNSRPLTPLSSDPTDLTFLTPAHFLVGDMLTALPEPSLLNIKFNRLSYWQRTQQMFQHFWKTWSSEYLSLLQNRSRWKHRSHLVLKPGLIVIIKEDNIPLLNWKLGRVIELHPGTDGITRIVSVRTSSGTSKMAVSRICLLPVDINNGIGENSA